MVQWPASYSFRDSIVASIPACHAGDRGSIPRRGVIIFCPLASIVANQYLNPHQYSMGGEHVIITSERFHDAH
jgi:hypothetical protein